MRLIDSCAFSLIKKCHKKGDQAFWKREHMVLSAIPNCTRNIYNLTVKIYYWIINIYMLDVSTRSWYIYTQTHICTYVYIYVNICKPWTTNYMKRTNWYPHTYFKTMMYLDRFVFSPCLRFRKELFYIAK